MASQNTSTLISQVYKSRTILLQLMEKQGYDVSEYQDFSVVEINTMKTNNQLDMILEKKTNKDDTEELPDKTNTTKIYIKYYLGKTLRPNNLQEMIDDLFNVEEVLTKNDTLLIVVKSELNETLINALKHIWESEKIFIIVQPLLRLQFNILKHTLVPPQRIISSEETEIVKRKYNIMEDSQWPEISRFDPVMLVIGIKPGEICEIIRPNKSSIVEKYYRLCTNN